MPRPKKIRLIKNKARTTYFKPRGIPTRRLKTATLTHDEWEAIRLADYQGLHQQKAALKMAVSRPTFQRIIKQARYKLSQALIEGFAIQIKGGEYTMNPRGRGLGRGQGIGPITPGGGRGRMRGPLSAGPNGACICTNPECKHEIDHLIGQPCYNLKCPKCGGKMTRKP